VGSGGKNGKFSLLFLHKGGIAVAWVYLSIFRQDENLARYGFDYLPQRGWRLCLARATGERFAGQLKAYRAAKEIYIREQRLMAIEEALKNIRKIFTVADQNDTQITILDLQEKPITGLLDVEIPSVRGSSER